MAGDRIEFREVDLAPGDARSRELDFRAFDVDCITQGSDPLFKLAYDRLWMEFGAQNELESAEVLQRRLAWHPAKAIGTHWFRYELMLVRRQGEFVAARDHTAIVATVPQPHVVVHLSHVLVDPASRRTGLAGWLRAWPIQTARACLAASGLPVDSPITLAGEMEPADPHFPNRKIRLSAYEKAGFRKVDPDQVQYFQPDFRPPPEIDKTGGPQPLPFSLILRRVGRENESTIRGSEVRGIVECLYQMYSQDFRPNDMAAARRAFQCPGEQAEIPLVSPTR